MATREFARTPTANASDSQAKPNINVTPLIDVLLVMLIIFMVVSPLKPARFRRCPRNPIGLRKMFALIRTRS